MQATRMQRIRSSFWFGPAVAATAFALYAGMIVATTSCTKPKPMAAEFQKAKPAPDRNSRDLHK